MSKNLVVIPAKSKQPDAPTHSTRWVDPIVAALILAGPPDAWPWTLYADNGTKPVTFNTPNELRAATAEESPIITP